MGVTTVVTPPPRPSSSASSTTTRPQSTITGAPTRALVLLLLFAVAILLLLYCTFLTGSPLSFHKHNAGYENNENNVTTGTPLPATPPTRSEVIATPFLKKRAWIIHVPGSDEDDEKPELEGIARDLGGNITEYFHRAQYIVVSQEGIGFEELVELLDTGLTSNEVRECIKNNGIRVVHRSWLDDCAKDSSNSLSSPGEKYTHLTQPLSSRKQKPKLDPSGRKPKNVSTPLVVKPVPATAAISRQLVFSDLFDSSTTTNNSSNSDKDRRKSAPVGALKTSSAFSQSGSDDVPWLTAMKFKEALNEEKVEGLMFELDKANIEKEAMREELKEKIHELDMYGYHQYETQEEHGATNDENGALSVDDDKEEAV